MSVRRSSSLAISGACALIGLLACTKGTASPRVPLAQAEGAVAAPAAGQAPQIPSAARAGLDSGNAAFRGGRYDAALAAYRAAAAADPDNAAPYFGIYMVAQKLGNKGLADSANEAIRTRSAGSPMLSDSTMRALHTTTASKKAKG